MRCWIVTGPRQTAHGGPAASQKTAARAWASASVPERAVRHVLHVESPGRLDTPGQGHRLNRCSAGGIGEAASDADHSPTAAAAAHQRDQRPSSWSMGLHTSAAVSHAAVLSPLTGLRRCSDIPWPGWARGAMASICVMGIRFAIQFRSLRAAQIGLSRFGSGPTRRSHGNTNRPPCVWVIPSRPSSMQHASMLEPRPVGCVLPAMPAPGRAGALPSHGVESCQTPPPRGSCRAQRTPPRRLRTHGPSSSPASSGRQLQCQRVPPRLSPTLRCFQAS